MNTKILDNMTPLQIKSKIIYTEKLKDALIEVGKEFIKRVTKKEKNNWIRQDTWRFENVDYENDSYLIIDEWYSLGATDEIPYSIPYRAINDMDGAVEEYFKEKARKEEEARQKAQQKKLNEITKKEQEEYDEYLHLKAKFENS